jgi:hypothetical protein
MTLLFPQRTPLLITENMLFTRTVILYASRTLQTLRIHHYTQCSRKETCFAQEINGTTILIDKVSKLNTLMMTIPGSIGKFYRTLRRHDEDDNKKKMKTYLCQTGEDDLIGFKDEIPKRGGGDVMTPA